MERGLNRATVRVGGRIAAVVIGAIVTAGAGWPGEAPAGRSGSAAAAGPSATAVRMEYQRRQRAVLLATRSADATTPRAAVLEAVELYLEVLGDERVVETEREKLLNALRARLATIAGAHEREARKRAVAAARVARATTHGVPGRTVSTGSGVSTGGTESTGAIGLTAGGAGGAAGGGDYGPELVMLIRSVLRPDSWDVNGGPATVQYWRPGRALVIRQTTVGHEEVQALLRQLRQ